MREKRRARARSASEKIRVQASSVQSLGSPGESSLSVSRIPKERLMVRAWLVGIAISLAGASTLAQSSARSLLRPITTTVRDAGVYHFGLGTWTRHVDSTNGVQQSDIQYSNSCPTGYFLGLHTNEFVADEGRLPGPHGPVLCDTGLLSTNKGCNCTVMINAFQIGYCSGLPGFTPVALNIGFQSAYVACTSPNPLPQAPGTFDLTGLPGAGSSLQGCWLVTIDLEATSQTFDMHADGASCTWAASGDLAINHLFGWTFQNRTPVTTIGTSYVGPMIAGNGGAAGIPPTPACSMVDNTRWDTLTCVNQGGGPNKWPNNMTEDGWGMDTQDRFRDDTTQPGGPIDSPSGPGCFFFGGNPFASFHLKLFGEEFCCPPGLAGCFDQPECRPGIDFIAPCPCNANQPTNAGAGCNALGPGNVLTGGATIVSNGTSSLSGTQPGVNTLQLMVSSLPTSASESAYLLQGPTLIAPVTFGQGLRCVAGQIRRLQIHSPAPGNSTWPAPGDFAPTIQARSAQLGDPLSPGSVRHYFVQYRQSLFIPPCTFPSNFNASNATFVTWAP
jgi:hypothetical protein